MAWYSDYTKNKVAENSKELIVYLKRTLMLDKALYSYCLDNWCFSALVCDVISGEYAMSKEKAISELTDYLAEQEVDCGGHFGFNMYPDDWDNPQYTAFDWEE